MNIWNGAIFNLLFPLKQKLTFILGTSNFEQVIIAQNFFSENYL